MPALACKCLNVQASLSTTVSIEEQCRTVLPEELSSVVGEGEVPVGTTHGFFDEGVFVVTLNICGITHNVPDLVKSFNITANWTCYKCLCCGMTTHAIHAPTATHTVNKNLIRDDAISSLYDTIDFSPLFKIVLPPLPVDAPSLPEQIHESTGSLQLFDIRCPNYEAHEMDNVRSSSSVPDILTEGLPPSVMDLYKRYTKSKLKDSLQALNTLAAKQERILQKHRERANQDSYRMLHLLKRIEADGSTTAMNSDNTEAGRSQIATNENVRPSDDLSLRQEDLFDRGFSPVNGSPHSSDDDTTDIEDFYGRNRASESESEDEAAPDNQTVPIAQSMPISIPYLQNRPTRRRKRRDGEPKTAKTSREIAKSILAISKSLHHNSGLPPPSLHDYYVL